MATTYQKGNGQRNDAKETALATTSDPRYAKLRGILEMSKTQIGQIVSRMISPDELVRLFLNATCKTPQLLSCAESARGIASIGLSLMKAAAMGLRPDGRNGHLIPFWNDKDKFMECQFFPDYKGMVKLMCLSPKVATVNGGSIRVNDQFECSQGTDEFLHYRKAMRDRGELIGAFAYYKTPTGQTCFRVLNADEVLKRRDLSKSFKGQYPQYSPWTQWEDEMWAKSALHDLGKVAPLGDAYERASQIDALDEAGALTESDLRMMSHNSGTKSIEHQPTESAFEPQTDDRRQTEPAETKQKGREPAQQKEQVEPVTAESFLQRIENAINATALKTIATDASQAWSDGHIDSGDHDRISVMLQEARRRM